MAEKLEKWPSDEGRCPESGYRMAVEGMPFSWRWTSGTISTNLDFIWGMSGNMTFCSRNSLPGHPGTHFELRLHDKLPAILPGRGPVRPPYKPLGRRQFRPFVITSSGAPFSGLKNPLCNCHEPVPCLRHRWRVYPGQPCLGFCPIKEGSSP